MKDDDGEIRLITDTAALTEACERLGKDDFLAVDTEFHRETTYWPQVCLIQAMWRAEARIPKCRRDTLGMKRHESPTM